MNADKVIWQEGMLLRPQHFQHQDRYYAHQLNTRTRLLNRYGWGFFELDIDTQFLGMGKLVISHASGIFPDGSLFDLRGDAEPLALDLPPNSERLPIYLALALVTGNHVEARRPEQLDALARYVTRETSVIDSNAGGDPAAHPVNSARPDFKLLQGDRDVHHAYVKLKLCEVLNVSSDSAVSLAPAFVPTYLHVHACAYLRSCLKEVISLLGYRGDAIADRIRDNGKAAGTEAGDLLLLQVINRAELLLRHALDSQQVHPETLYRTLLALLGDLSTFSGESKRPQLGNHYRHSDQGASFRQLMGSIREMLSTVLEQHAIELELQPRPYGMLVSPLHDPSLLDSASFVLAAGAQCDGDVLRQHLPAHLKVGPVERIRQLVNLHLPGIRLRTLPVAPRQIAFHANKTYFALELSADDRAQLQRSGGFAFHASGDFDELQLQFWAIRN